MEKKIINNRYELIACTAISVEAGDTEAQNAIYCRDMESSDGDCVIFGYALHYQEHTEQYKERWQQWYSENKEDYLKKKNSKKNSKEDEK